MEILGQPLQAGRLSPVQLPITFRIVADQDLAERGGARLDVFGEIVAVLEVELILTSLLGGACDGVSVSCRVAEDGGAELLVYQDPCLFLGHTRSHGLLESVVNDPLGGGDLR